MKRNKGDNNQRRAGTSVMETPAEQELVFYSDRREYADKKRAAHKKAGTRRLAVFLAVMLAAALIYMNWDKLSPATIGSTVTDYIDGIGKSKFPVILSQGNFVKSVQLGGNLGVLTDTGFLIYSSSGTLLAERQHGMSSPSVESSGSYAVLFDRGGKQYKIESRTTETSTAQTAYPITSAAVSQNGCYALVTESGSYLSEIRVYNQSGKNFYTYYSAEGRVLSASLSPDGGSLAAVVVGAKDGDTLSTVKYLYTDSQKTAWQKSYPGLLLFGVQFKNSSELCAVGDKETIFFSGDGREAQKLEYGDRVLKGYSSTPNGTVLVFSKYGVGSASDICSYYGSGALRGEAEVNADIRYVFAGQNSIVAYAQQSIWHASGDCGSAGTIKVNGDMMGALAMNGRVYAFGLQSIYRYDG